MMNHAKVFYPLLGLMIFSLILASCSPTYASQPLATSTVASIPTPAPTSTLASTATPVPTYTPVSTDTPVPTSTSVLKSTIQATEEISAAMPEYAKPGPYTVALTNLQLPQHGFMLDVHVWYPAQMNGNPDSKGGPFPLVVFASGFRTPSLLGYHYLLNHLASYGFVTATWEPRLEGVKANGIDMIAPLGYRPADYKLLVDNLESMGAQGGPLEGMIDMKRIAIAGHSMGGGTALEMSGAPIDFSWCSAHKNLVAKSQEMTCTGMVNYQKEIASSLGLQTIPKGKWPQISDPRIVAMIGMAPMGEMWGAEYDSLASVQVPALIMVGSNDWVLPPDYGAYSVYQHLGSSKKLLVVFIDKSHELFFGLPYSSGTQEDLYRIMHITTAFLLTEVKGDQEAAKALSPANINFSGVKYEATGY